MTTHAVLEANDIAATYVGTYTRPAICSGSAVDNGNVFRLDSVSSASGYGEVWVVTKPATSYLDGLWMANTPENVMIESADGEVFSSPSVDVRNFYNIAGKIIDAYKPQVGDLITLTADAFSAAFSSNTHANAANGLFTLVWGNSQTASALSYKYLATTYISMGSAAIASGRVTAYKLECIAN